MKTKGLAVFEILIFMMLVSGAFAIFSNFLVRKNPFDYSKILVSEINDQLCLASQYAVSLGCEVIVSCENFSHGIMIYFKTKYPLKKGYVPREKQILTSYYLESDAPLSFHFFSSGTSEGGELALKNKNIKSERLLFKLNKFSNILLAEDGDANG